MLNTLFNSFKYKPYFKVGIENSAELEQSLIRLLVVMCFFPFILWKEAVAGDVGLTVFIIAIAYSITNIILVVNDVFNATLRRYVSTTIDIGICTFLINRMDYTGFVFQIIYLWVVFGNGFRYGKTHLVFTQSISILSVLYIFETNPYWYNLPNIAISSILMLIILPIYVSSMLDGLSAIKKKAEDANEAKTNFIENMNHEIRTPMNGIMGIIALLKKSSLSKTQQDHITGLESASNLLLGLLNNTLDITKIEEGTISLINGKHDISRICMEVASIYEGQLKTRNNTMDKNIEKFVHYYHVDAIRLKQVLANILGNSVKFTEHGIISFSAWIIKDFPDSSIIRFDIKDTGIGIPKSKLQFIFERFYQLHSDKTFSGSGLGLTISKSLLQLMGSHIHVKSNLGEGSQFWFDLTLEKAEKISNVVSITRATSYDHEAKRLLNIILAEDDIISRSVMAEMLENCGHDVTIIDNGFDLLEALKTNVYDLAIIDHNMPIMTGTKAAQLYSESTSEKHTRIIMVSANCSSELYNTAAKAGIENILNKPVDFKNLTSIINLKFNIKEPNPEIEEKKPKLTNIENIPSWKGLIDKKYIDESKIEDLYNIFTKPGELCNCITTYINSMDSFLEKIKTQCLLTEDGEFDVKPLIHTCSGASANIGAFLLWNTLKNIEMMDDVNLFEHRKFILKLIEKDYEFTKVALLDICKLKKAN